MLSTPYSGQYTGTTRFPLHTWQCYQHHIVANILGQPDSPCTPSSAINTIQWPIYWESQIPLAHLAMLSAPYSGQYTGTARFPLHTWQCYQHHIVANILGQPDSPCTPSSAINTIQWPIYWGSQIPVAHLAVLSTPYSGQYTGTARFPLHTWKCCQHHTVANILGQPDSPCTPGSVINAIQWPIYWDSQIPLAHLAMLSAPYSGQYTGTARFPLHTWQCYQHHIVANILGQPDSPCTPGNVISTI